jgi:hypothetical protein
VGRVTRSPEQARDAAIAALEELRFTTSNEIEVSSEDIAPAWSLVLVAVLEAARFAGVDLEGVLRASALRLLDEIRTIEGSTEK